MVAEQTKSVVDGAFGHVKRRRKTTDVITPQDMIGVAREIGIANVCVPGSGVLWESWKLYFERYFTIPAGFPILKYQKFTFTSSKAGIFKAKKFLLSCEERMFSLLGRGIRVDVIRSEATLIFMSDDVKSSMTPLYEVASSQHETRRNYLLRNTIDKSYADNVDISSAFLKSWYWEGLVMKGFGG